jgi:hypothetical protein
MRIVDKLPRLGSIIIHPFVFAVFPILSLYVGNMDMTSLAELFRAVVFLLICAALFWWVLNLVVKDSAKSATIVSAFALLFFAYGYALLGLTTVLVRLRRLDRARFLVEGQSSHVLWLSAWVILLVAVAVLVARQRSDLRAATGFLNAASVAFLAILGVRFAVGAGELLDKARLQDVWQQYSRLPGTGSTPEPLPNIYYIVVDAYARGDVLEEVYELDNGELLSDLVDKGFYVADQSRANYAQTTLSLASSLNFAYLDQALEYLEPEMQSRILMQIMIQDNKLVRFLRQHGYAIVEFSSGYDYTGIEHDLYMEPFTGWSPSQFEEGAIMLTPLSAFSKTWADFRRQRVLYAFEHIAEPADDGQPTFVFVHVLVPHWPFLFDAEGNPIQPKGLGSHVPVLYDEFIAYYSDQLLFVNQLLCAAIDRILTQSTRPPIIVVQADHGPDAGKNLVGSTPDSFMMERMAILNAIYFPDRAYERLYEDITPVNTFRVLLGQYFDVDLDLLEDRSFYSDYAHPYSFTEVTEQTSE